MRHDISLKMPKLFKPKEIEELVKDEYIIDPETFKDYAKIAAPIAIALTVGYILGKNRDTNININLR